MSLTKLWAKLVLMWHGYCPKHICKRLSYRENTHERHGYARHYIGVKCNKCMDIVLEKKTARIKKAKTLIEQRIERAVNDLKTGDEKWHSV